MLDETPPIKCFFRSVVFLIGIFVYPVLATAEPTFRQAFEKHNAIMLLIDPGNGDIVDANPAASRFYGYSRAHLRTMTIQQINQFTAEQVAAERKLAKTEGRNFFIFRHRLADGSIRTVEVHSVPLNFDGRTILYSIIRDISKERDLERDLWHYQTRLEEMVDLQTISIRKNSRLSILLLGVGTAILLALVFFLYFTLRNRNRVEAALRESDERYELAVRQASIWDWDLKTDKVYFSPMFSEMLEYTKEEFRAILDDSIMSIIHPDDVASYKEVLISHLEHPSTLFENEHRFRLKSGEYRWYHARGQCVCDSGGKAVRSVGLIIDITDRKRAEQQLLEAKEEAVKANRTKTEFLASMSHELRTPLNAVLGFAQMLQFNPESPLSQTQNAHVENILDGGNHLLELVNEILDLARVEADQLDLFLEEVNANEVVADCINMTISIGEQRGISIVDRFSGEPRTILRTDRVRLKQILINLLSNAIKFNKSGGKVTVDSQKTDDGFLRISVSDTGIGIARRDYPGVFRMFHRLDADPMISREGTGIGLTVTKLLVERMAGRLGFESEENVGSTFWIELPLAENENVLIWTDAMRVGVDAIDKDHQILISLLNRMMHKPANNKEMDKIIEELVDYTRIHFRREEAIMAVCGYPDLEKHCDLHRNITTRINDLARAWRKDGDRKTLDQLRGVLPEMLFSDVLNSDSDIVRYAKGRDRDIREALKSLE